MKPTSQDLDREVYCQDALPWLQEHTPLTGASLITSLPDTSGLSELSLDEWKQWFVAASLACMNATPDDGVSIFYQTDIKREGLWIDKSYLCQRAADLAGAHLLWHKIVCRKTPGATAFGRPGYGHLLCFSRGVRDRISQSYTDVLPETGEMTWSRATGVAACELACRYVRSHTESQKIVDPFCGTGAILAVANRLGFSAVGVELGRRRASKARTLQL